MTDIWNEMPNYGPQKWSEETTPDEVQQLVEESYKAFFERVKIHYKPIEEKAEKWNEIYPYLRKHGIIAKHSFNEGIVLTDKLPNLVGINKAIGDTKYVLKCLTMTKEAILEGQTLEETAEES